MVRTLDEISKLAEEGRFDEITAEEMKAIADFFDLMFNSFFKLALDEITDDDIKQIDISPITPNHKRLESVFKIIGRLGEFPGNDSEL